MINRLKTKLREGTWGVLKEPLFRILWLTNLTAFVATWMHEVSVSWLMTSLTLSPFTVSLVQTAMTVPYFLLSLPAGALADIVDRRRLIIFTRLVMMTGALGLAILTLSGLVSPATILFFTFLISLGASVNSPVWQALVPDLVSSKDLPRAVTLGSAAFNIARIVGPALGGIVIGLIGPGWTFLFNAFLFSTILMVLSSWKHKPVTRSLPAERFFGAMRAGVRYTRNAPQVKALLIHIGVFSFFATSLLSFIPLIGRAKLGLGPSAFGMLYGCFGVGGLLGAALLPTIRNRVPLNTLVTISRIVFALIIASLAISNTFSSVALVLFIGGFTWLILISTFNITVQTLIPAWVRGRVVSVYMLSFFGSMALGSALWGFTASWLGIRNTLFITASCIVAGILFTLRYKLATGEEMDFTPHRYQYWLENSANDTQPGMEEGPVLVVVEYRVDPGRIEEFLEAMGPLKSIRLRDGAFRWNLFRDLADNRYFIESFIVESWVEHLRQHDRRTVSDQAIVDHVRSFHRKGKPLRIRHFLAEPVYRER